MPATRPEPTVAQQLEKAVQDLKTALARASDATANIKALLPEMVEAGTVLDEITALVGNGRNRTTPMPVADADLAVASLPHDTADDDQASGPGPSALEELPLASARQDAAGTVCFRIEFESSGGPLDLRTVDDAIGAHPAVRDVALLDYDGRHAALKVWITSDTTPAEVQADLRQRIPQLFSSHDDISVVALEDVA